MKKIVYSAAIVCILALAVSCKSTKTEKKASGDNYKKQEVSEIAEDQEESAEDEADDEEDEEADASKKKPAKADVAETEQKDFTGWIKSSRKNINERFGNIQIKIKARVGSFTLAALNENDKAIPVLSTANEYISNAFYLKTSKKIYNLVTDGNVRTAARRTTDGAAILYEVPDVAQITVNFSFFPSEKQKDINMIKVTATIKNSGKRTDEYTFKSVLDTVLGEAANYHFYTFEDVPVKNEVLYRTLQNQKWFVSKNVNAAMQLFYSGADCTAPDLVALANYSTLEKNTWEPDMLSYRVFDTLLSYNNSAVCAIWKPMKLEPSASGKIIFYIALSGDGSPATGEKYVYSKEFEEKEPAPEKSENSGKSVTGLEVITPFSVEDEQKPDSITEIPEDDSLVVEKPGKPQDIPNVDFYIKNMTKEHLTPEYIQSLLDRIAALEEDSPSLNRQELLQLNAELDAILTYLRQ